MKSFLNKLFQITAVAGQVTNQFGGLVPAKYQPPIAIGIGILQGVAGAFAHYYNPDGTPAETPWKK